MSSSPCPYPQLCLVKLQRAARALHALRCLPPLPVLLDPHDSLAECRAFTGASRHILRLLDSVSRGDLQLLGHLPPAWAPDAYRSSVLAAWEAWRTPRVLVLEASSGVFPLYDAAALGEELLLVQQQFEAACAAVRSYDARRLARVRALAKMVGPLFGAAMDHLALPPMHIPITMVSLACDYARLSSLVHALIRVSAACHPRYEDIHYGDFFLPELVRPRTLHEWHLGRTESGRVEGDGPPTGGGHPRSAARLAYLRAAEWATFSFPITSVGEFERLLDLEYGAPTGITVCEYSGAIRRRQLLLGRVFISVDTRASLCPGLHFQGDLRMVAHLSEWPDGVFGFTPCTHLLRRDSFLPCKMADGRSFLDLLLFVYVYCLAAACTFMEHPDTIVQDYFVPPTSSFRANAAGDPDTKRICAYIRGAPPLLLDPDWLVPARRQAGHFRSFANPTERDLHRSSWERLPRTADLVVAQVRPSTPGPRLLYQQQAELVAVRWYADGHPVLDGYWHERARLAPSAESYALARGAGDGRRPAGVVPLSLRVPPPLPGLWSTAPSPALAAAEAGVSPPLPAPLAQALSLLVAAHAQTVHAQIATLWLTLDLAAAAASSAHAGAFFWSLPRAVALAVDAESDSEDAAWATVTSSDSEDDVPAAAATGARVGREGAQLIRTAGAREEGLHAALPTVDVTNLLAANGVILAFVACLAQPLVLAHADGFTVVGAELPAGAPHAHLVDSWLATVFTAVVYSLPLGAYAGASALVAAPLPYQPPERHVCRSAAARAARLAAGAGFLWFTLAALVGTPVADVAARAFAGVDGHRHGIEQLSCEIKSAPGAAPAFAFGRSRVESVSKTHSLDGGLSPPGWLGLRRGLEEGDLLKTALLEQVGEGAADLHHWAGRVSPPDPSEIPPDLLSSLPDFGSSDLDELAFSEPAAPRRTSWLPRQPRQDPTPTPGCVVHAFDMIESVSKLQEVNAWLAHSLRDQAAIHRDGPAVRRDRPGIVVVGQEDLYPWARGRVFDCTLETASCCVPLDTHAPLRTHLNLGLLRRELVDYPDQRLLSNVLEGVRLEADLELHTVLMPHLVSLPLNMASVAKELRRMSQPPLRWYRMFNSPPYWPMYANAQGCTPRKLEPDRYRRTTEGGGPRRPVYDSGGLQVISINHASRLWHLPRHYEEDRRPEMASWLRHKGLPPSPAYAALPLDERLRMSKFPKEVKPSVEMLLRDLTVLRRASEVLGEPLYIFTDDAKDYFSQLALAPEERWKLNVVFLQGAIDQAPPTLPVSEHRVTFVSERVLGFGCHAASNIAQRFSDALLHIYRRRMRLAEAPYLCEGCDPRPAFAKWRAARLRVQHRATPHQLRLHTEHMFTDDAVFAVVGVQRAIRALKVWRALTEELNLLMAIPEKRTLGVWAPWLGVHFYTALGLVTIPPPKLLRATTAIQETLDLLITFDKYRSLVGLLEHIRSVYRQKRNVMFGLYEPHDALGGDPDPSSAVAVSKLMRQQFGAWLARLQGAGGVAFTAVVSGARRAAGLTAVITGDAANDVTAAGLGGYCHGFYWHFSVGPAAAAAMHITLLEFLAAAISLLAFHYYVRRFARVVLLSDALATPYALSRESEKSPALRFAHYLLRQTSAFQSLAPLTDVAHLSGDANAFADAASRQLWSRLRALARQTRVRLSSVPVPDEALRIFYECLRFVQQLPPRPRRALGSGATPLAAVLAPTPAGTQPEQSLALQLGGPWRALVIRCDAADAAGADYVYAGRGGNDHARAQGHARWGNYAWGGRIRSDAERHDAIGGFRARLLGDPAFVREVRENLRGKRLGCFCAPLDCHAHLLAEVANCSSRHLATLLAQHREGASGPGPSAPPAVGRRHATALALHRAELDPENLHPHPGPPVPMQSSLPPVAPHLHRFALKFLFLFPDGRCLAFRRHRGCSAHSACPLCAGGGSFYDLPTAMPSGYTARGTEPQLDGHAWALALSRALARHFTADVANSTAVQLAVADEFEGSHVGYNRSSRLSPRARAYFRLPASLEATAQGGRVTYYYEVYVVVVDQSALSAALEITRLRFGALDLDVVEPLLVQPSAVFGRAAPQTFRAPLFREAAEQDDTLGRIPGGGHPFISCTVLQMLDRLERKALWLRDGLTVARCSIVTTARCVACTAERDPHAWWLDRDVVNKHGGCRLHNRSCRETCPYGEETTPRVTWCHCDGFKHNPNTLLLCGGCGLNMCIWHMGGVPGQLGPHDREWEPNHDCSRYRGDLRSNMVPVRPPAAGPLALGWSSETASSRALSNRQLRAISANTMGDGPPLTPLEAFLAECRRGEAAAFASAGPSAAPVADRVFATNTVRETPASCCAAWLRDGRGEARPATQACCAVPSAACAGWLHGRSLADSVKPPRANLATADTPSQPSRKRRVVAGDRSSSLRGDALSVGCVVGDSPAQTFAHVLPNPNSHRHADSTLRARSREMAQTRLARLTDVTNPGALKAARPFLEAIFMSAEDLMDYGVNYNTMTKDIKAWDEWEDFCRVVDTDPLRTAEMMRRDPDCESDVLALFALWIYPRMKAREKTRRWAKPQSAFAYPLAIARIHGRWGVALPKLPAVRAKVQGLMRAVVTTFGAGYLTPQRKEPLTLEMLVRISKLNHADLGGRRWDSSGHFETHVLDILCFGLRTGFRLAELVFHPSGEIMYLMRGDVRAVVRDVTYEDPPADVLRQMSSGDYWVVTPPRSKTDQFGEIHCPYPSILAFDNSPLNAALRLRDNELRHPCHGEHRAATPLFADFAGKPYTHSKLDLWLNLVLVHLYGAARAKLYSWHSMRIGLACALRAANCPTETIQLICRWMCPESVRIYALKGISEHSMWISRADEVSVDAIRGTSYPVISADEAHQLLLDEARGGEGLSPASQANYEAAVADADLEEADGLARPRARPWSRGRTPQPKPLPARHAKLTEIALAHGADVPLHVGTIRARQVALLRAVPKLADQFVVPPDILRLVGAAEASLPHSGQCGAPAPLPASVAPPVPPAAPPPALAALPVPPAVVVRPELLWLLLRLPDGRLYAWQRLGAPTPTCFEFPGGFRRRNETLRAAAVRCLCSELAPDAASQLRAWVAAAATARPNGHGQALVGPLDTAHREYMTVVQLPVSGFTFRPRRPDDIARCVWRPEDELINDFLGSEYAFQRSRGLLLRAAVAGLQAEGPLPPPTATALPAERPSAVSSPGASAPLPPGRRPSGDSESRGLRRTPADKYGGSSESSESESSFADEVDFLVNSRVAGDGSVEFLVRWTGLSPRHDTWEPEVNVGLPLVRAFRARLRSSPGAATAGTPSPRPAFLAQLDAYGNYILVGRR